jgi:hypothetical protein
MKASDIKRCVSTNFGIPVRDIRVRLSHGWVEVWIREMYHVENNDFLGVCKRIEDKIAFEFSDCVSTYNTDDGYGTESNRIMVSFDDYAFTR